MNNIPPWGDSSDNPWKEFDLFEEWAATKKLRHINISDSGVLIELWELCSDVFMYDKEEQKTVPEVQKEVGVTTCFTEYIQRDFFE